MEHTMYVTPNFPTKKALKQAVANGDEVHAFQPGPFGGGQVPDGRHAVEGPHYPKPHTWYSVVQVKDGIVTKVVS